MQIQLHNYLNCDELNSAGARHACCDLYLIISAVPSNFRAKESDPFTNYVLFFSAFHTQSPNSSVTSAVTYIMQFRTPLFVCSVEHNGLMI